MRKDFEGFEFEGIFGETDHFFGTIYYRHFMEMYPAMIDWLDNTCNLKATASAAVGPASR